MKKLSNTHLSVLFGLLLSITITLASQAATIYYNDGKQTNNVSEIRKIGDSFLYKLDGKERSVSSHRVARILDDNGDLIYEPSNLTYSTKWDDKKGFVYNFMRNRDVIATGYWNANDCFVIETGSLIDGLYNEYYDSGILKSTLSVARGNLNGICKFYYDTGRIKRDGIFVNGKEEGISKLYDVTGFLSGTSEYKNGKKNGITKLLYKSGKTKAELNYQNGIIEGIQKTFYESGQLQSLITFKNGTRNGAIEEYYESGKLMMKGQFVNDSLDGKVIQYYQSGRVKSDKIFDKGILVKKN